jgi:hypothetical protein
MSLTHIERVRKEIEDHVPHVAHVSPIARIRARFGNQGEKSGFPIPASDNSPPPTGKGSVPAEPPILTTTAPPGRMELWPPEWRLQVITAEEAATIVAGCPPPPELKPCPVKGCCRRIKIDVVLCEPHWLMLTEETREAIWRLYDGNASRPWLSLERSQSAAFLATVREAASHLTIPTSWGS